MPEGRLGSPKTYRDKFSTTAGRNLIFACSFPAEAAVVDNLTNQWIFAPDSNIWIPPWNLDRVILLDSAQALNLQFLTPPGFVAATLDPTQIVSGYILSDQIPPSQGVIQNPVSLATLLGTVDVSDRAARLLGHVAVDSMPASTADVTDRAARLLGVIASITANVNADVIDRAARLLGHVTVDSIASATQPPMSGTTGVDVSDRAARLLGVIASITAAVDISDRSARLLGHVTVDTIAGLTGTWGQFEPNVPAGAGATTQLHAANVNRRGYIIYSSQNAGLVNITLGGVVMFNMAPGGYWEMPTPLHTGIVAFITSAAGQGGVMIGVEIT